MSLSSILLHEGRGNFNYYVNNRGTLTCGLLAIAFLIQGVKLVLLVSKRDTELSQPIDDTSVTGR